MRLICFPPAGGNAVHLRRWQDYLLPGVDIEIVQFPGHGARVAEQPIDRMAPLANLVADELHIRSDSQFAFFGHSMGALVAFEVARKLEERGLPGPLILFASGCPAPQVFDVNPKIHDLPDDEFLSRLQSLTGTPPELIANRELMALLLPALRADFSVCENYSYQPGKPLACRLRIWGGSTDCEVDARALESWQKQTSQECSIEILEGGHFFLFHQWASMIRTLNRELSVWCGSPDSSSRGSKPGAS